MDVGQFRWYCDAQQLWSVSVKWLCGCSVGTNHDAKQLRNILVKSLYGYSVGTVMYNNWEMFLYYCCQLSPLFCIPLIVEVKHLLIWENYFYLFRVRHCLIWEWDVWWANRAGCAGLRYALHLCTGILLWNAKQIGTREVEHSYDWVKGDAVFRFHTWLYSTWCIYVFLMGLTINSKYFPKWY
jgi:hypothetical protein